MITPYYNLFCLIDKLLKKLEGGFSYQTDSNRAFSSAAVISFLEIFNINCIWKEEISQELLIFILFILFIANLFIFTYKKRYRDIVLRETNNKGYLYLVSSLYILVSIGTFVVYVSYDI